MYNEKIYNYAIKGIEHEINELKSDYDKGVQLLKALELKEYTVLNAQYDEAEVSEAVGIVKDEMNKLEDLRREIKHKKTVEKLNHIMAMKKVSDATDKAMSEIKNDGGSN